MVLVIKLYARLNALLIERLQNHVASTISRIAATSNWSFAVVARVATEATLVNLSVRGAIEWESHALEFNDRRDRFAG